MSETEYLGSRAAPRRDDVKPAASPPPKGVALARPQTAPATTRGPHTRPSVLAPERQHGRVSLYDRERRGIAHAYQGPKVLRALEPAQHGFPLKGPDEFLKQGEGKSLRQRNRLRELLKKYPVDRDPQFQKGTGGVHLSWESVPSAQSLFRHLYDIGTIDFVSMRWGVTVNEVVWGQQGKRPGIMCWGDRPVGLELAKWLPIFLEGIREYKEPYRFLAIMGSHDLISEAGERLREFAADLIPPLKKALDTREPTVVTIAVELMQSVLLNDPEVAKLWIYYLRDFAQVFNLFLSHGYLVHMGYNTHRIQSVKQAITDFIIMLQHFGGEHSTALVRKFLRVDPAVTDDTFRRQTSKAEQKAGHKPWQPYLLI